MNRLPRSYAWVFPTSLFSFPFLFFFFFEFWFTSHLWWISVLILWSKLVFFNGYECYLLKSKHLCFSNGSDGKESACNARDPRLIPSQEDPLEKGMATHSSIPAWRIPMNRGAWQATEWLTLSFFPSCCSLQFCSILLCS